MTPEPRNATNRRRPATAAAFAALALAALAAGCATVPSGCPEGLTIQQNASGEPEFGVAPCQIARSVQAPAIARTALPGAGPRTVERIIRDGDLAALTAMSQTLSQSDDASLWRIAPVLDAIAAGAPAEARRILDQGPAGAPGAVRQDLLLVRAFLAAAEGDAAQGADLLQDGWSEPTEPRSRALALMQELADQPAAALRLYAELAAAAPGPPPRDGEAEVTAQIIAARLRAWRTAELFRRKATLEHRLELFAAAEQSYRRVLDYAPGDPEALVGLDRAAARAAPQRPPLTAAGGLARALSDLADAQSIELIVRGGMSGDFAIAKRAEFVPQMFRAFAAALDPAAQDLTLNAAAGFSGLQEPAATLRAVDRAAAEGPLAAGLALLRAEALIEAGQREEARAALRGLSGRLTLREGFAKALLHARLLEDAAAFATFEAVAPPANAPADDRIEFLRARALAHDFFDRPDAAVADLRAAVALSGRRDARTMLAGVLGEHPNPRLRAEGLALWRTLLAEREDPSTLNGVAWTLLQDPTAETLKEAHLFAMRAAAAAPRSPAIVDTLGWSFYLHGDFLSARRELARAAELAEEDPIAEIFDHLGDALWRLGQIEEARATWREGLDAEPDVGRRRALEAKLRDGLTTPAPPQRTPPEAGMVGPPARTGPRTDV